MMMDVTQQPFGTTLGLFGWPHPSEALTLWRDRVVAERRTPTPEAVAEMKSRVLANMRSTFPILARWAESMEWLQGLGRGDLVGVMDLRSGAVLLHTCLAGSEDYRDSQDLIWNWQWVLSTADIHTTNVTLDTYVDASGALLDWRGNPTRKVLVQPILNVEEARTIVSEWHSTVGPMVAQRPAVKTWPVEYSPFNEEAYAEECRKALEPLP
jgi:hypothetical protein